MKHLFVVSAAASVALCCAAPALARSGVTLGPVNVRVAPRAGAPILMEVPPDAQVDVDWCRNGWCAISWRYQAGYAPARWIAVQPTVYVPPPAPPAVYVVPGYGFGHGWGPEYGHHGRRW